MISPRNTDQPHQFLPDFVKYLADKKLTLQYRQALKDLQLTRDKISDLTLNVRCYPHLSELQEHQEALGRRLTPRPRPRVHILDFRPEVPELH